MGKCFKPKTTKSIILKDIFCQLNSFLSICLNMTCKIRSGFPWCTLEWRCRATSAPCGCSSKSCERRLSCRHCIRTLRVITQKNAMLLLRALCRGEVRENRQHVLLEENKEDPLPCRLNHSNCSSKLKLILCVSHLDMKFERKATVEDEISEKVGTSLCVVGAGAHVVSWPISDSLVASATCRGGMTLFMILFMFKSRNLTTQTCKLSLCSYSCFLSAPAERQDFPSGHGDRLRGRHVRWLPIWSGQPGEPVLLVWVGRPQVGQVLGWKTRNGTCTRGPDQGPRCRSVHVHGRETPTAGIQHSSENRETRVQHSWIQVPPLLLLPDWCRPGAASQSDLVQKRLSQDVEAVQPRCHKHQHAVRGFHFGSFSWAVIWSSWQRVLFWDLYMLRRRCDILLCYEDQRTDTDSSLWGFQDHRRPDGWPEVQRRLQAPQHRNAKERSQLQTE